MGVSVPDGDLKHAGLVAHRVLWGGACPHAVGCACFSPGGPAWQQADGELAAWLAAGQCRLQQLTAFSRQHSVLMMPGT
jgi:hypothetical protein